MRVVVDADGSIAWVLEKNARKWQAEGKGAVVADAQKMADDASSTANGGWLRCLA